MAPFDRKKVICGWVLLANHYTMNCMCFNSRKRIYKKRSKVRDWFHRRVDRGFTENIVREFQSDDPKEYEKMFRVSTGLFQEILSKITPYIQKKDTNMKLAIPTEIALAITLKYLADGTSYNSLSYEFRVSKSYISVTIPKVCDALACVLADYIKVPSSADDWLQISKDFHQKWDFPHCVGAVDGKHIAIVKPPNSGSEYFNYKGFFSIVLLASVDANARIIAYDLGRPGSCSDAGIYNSSKLSQLPLPHPTPLGNYPAIGYFNIGDEAFPLSERMMKPFSRRSESSEESIFNYRLSRARRIAENCFGIMASRFRILRKPAHNSPDNLIKIMTAIMALHNFLITEKLSIYAPFGYQDQAQSDGTFVTGRWREDTIMLQPLSRSRTAFVTNGQRNREILKDYFMNEGEKTYQWSYLL